jgi:hypothetical protein
MNIRFWDTAEFAAAALFIFSLTSISQAFPAREGEPCGKIAGMLQCEEALFCEKPANRCGTSDTEGVCVKIPEVCNIAILSVCGCNGKTYDNDCERRRAGVQKLKDGPC